MDDDVLHALALRHFQQRVDVRDVAVHAAVRDEPEEVQCGAFAGRLLHRREQGFIFKEAAVFDILRDAGQILVDDPAGAHVHVADFRIAHLAVRKAHMQAARLPLYEGIVFHETVQDRGLRRLHGVALYLLGQAETVHDHQHRGSFHSGSTTFAKSGFRDAPPTRPPSMSGCSKSSFAFLGATLPP